MHSRGRLLTLGVVAVAALAARPCAADEPVAPVVYDAGAYPPPSARGSLLLVGAATTTVWYGMALGSSLAWPGAAGANHLQIPVAGPWMALGDTGCDSDESDCSTVWVVVRAILISIDGVGQAGGLAAMAEAAFLPTAPAKPAKQSARRSISFAAVPLVTERSGLGIGVVGQF
jgi:hypothetical protein